MDFELPQELTELQLRARRFVEEKVVPYEKGWPEALEDAPKDIVASMKEKAKEAGLINVTVPKEYGGQGLGNLAYVVLCEECSKTSVPILFVGVLGPFHGVHPQLYQASEHLKEKYLWPVLRGEKDWGVAFTEPEAGSDLSGIQTTAVKQGDNYVLNGHKIFASKAATADYMLVGAYTDKKKGYQGMSTFLVDTDTPGFKVLRRVRILGGWTEEEIKLENCVVPAENMVGGESEGFRQAMDHFNKVGRLGTAAQVLGMAGRSLDLAIRYVKKRRVFGKSLGQFQGIQWMIVDSRVDIEAMKWFVYHTAWKADRNEDLRLDAAMCKLYCVHAAQRVVDHALQIHGGMGLSEDLPLAYFYNAVRRVRVAEGTMEIMRLIITRQLLGREMTV